MKTIPRLALSAHADIRIPLHAEQGCLVWCVARCRKGVGVMPIKALRVIEHEGKPIVLVPVGWARTGLDERAGYCAPCPLWVVCHARLRDRGEPRFHLLTEEEDERACGVGGMWVTGERFEELTHEEGHIDQAAEG